MTGLVGTGRVADDLYLIAHHEINGKPYVQPRALGLGLVGGLVTELMLAGHISLWREEVVAADRVVPGEELTGRLLRVLAGERDRVLHPLFGEVAARIEIVVDGRHEKLPGVGQIAARWQP